MTDGSSPRETARRERLRAALRENLKRRKSQAKGRTAGAIVAPEDDRSARQQRGESPDLVRSEENRD